MPVRHCLIPVLLCSLPLAAQPDISSLYEMGRYEKVVELVTQTLERNDTSSALYLLKALSESHLGQPVAAIQTAEQGLARHGNEDRLSRLLARLYYEAGYYPDARDRYLLLVGSDSLDKPSWLKLAEIGTFRQEYGPARDALDRVLAMDSLNADALVMKAELLQRLDSPDAVKYLERVGRNYPDNQKAAYSLANLYIRDGHPESAIPVCERILETDTANIRFTRLLGYALYKSGDHFRAARVLEKAASLGDSTAFCHKFMGISKYLNVDMGGAVKALRYAAGRDSLDAETHFFLGASLAQCADKSGAMDHMDRALELLEPDAAVVSRIYAEQGNLKRLQESYMEACSLYSLAWEADSTNLMALYFRASILDNSLHCHDRALEDYRFFIEQLDRQPQAASKDKGIPTIREIVENRIISLEEERFFRDR